MSLTLNTNVAALTAHKNMLSNDTAMTTSLERLSTGLRINSAADDASGMTIADSLKSQYLGIGQGIENANEGVSIVQIADGALEESINIVNTIKTKAIQAASDGQTSDTRAAIQADIDKLLEELDSIAETTSYNGQQLLNGEFTNKEIQVGSSSNQTSTINIGSAASTDTGHISTANLAMDSEDGGEVQLTITSAMTGEEVELEAIEILQNNSAENGMGALADEINTQTYRTGITALAVVESTTDEAIQEGATGSDFAINGVNIGAINVSDNDSDSALVTAINDKTTDTGVTASMETNGSLTLTSDDGRAITVTGDTGEVFGSQSAEDLTTIGYITLTQEGSSQFNISGTSSGGIGDAITLDADLETISDSSLGAGSTIAKGSILAAGSEVGGDAVVNVTVEETLSDYEMVQGSTLGAGSVLSQGTVVGGSVTVAGETGTPAVTSLNQDMLVTQGSTLAAGTILGAGTTITSTFTDNGTTYAAGKTLTTNVTLTSDLNVSKDITLSDDSSVAAGSSLAQGSVMGADIEIGVTWDSTTDPAADLTGNTSSDAVVTAASADLTANAITLAAGSTLADGSTVAVEGTTYAGPTLVTTTGTLNTGDTIVDGTSYTLDGTQTLTDDLTTDATGATLLQGSIIAEGSAVGAQTLAAASYDIATLDTANMTEAMTLKAGSDLAGGSLLVAGSTLGDATTVTGDNGGNLSTYAKTEVAAGSTLETGSVLAEGSVVEEAITIDGNTELDNAMTLKAGSTLNADSIFTAGTTISQDMTLNTATGGGTTTEVEVTAGTVLTQDLYLDDNTFLSESMTLEAGSTISDGSELIIDSEGGGDLTLSDEESLTLSDLSVMTQADAQIAIDIADAALADLDATRSSLGSVQNQLTSTIANLSVTSTNVQSAESSIRDVDFAEETANYTRLSLLAQTSSYALAQANSSSQNVLSLLQ